MQAGFRPEVSTPVQAPHRGAAILTLGILGICVIFVCGIIAWVLGRADLKAMAEGRMDPRGEGLTRAGVICGIVGTCLGVVAIVFVVWMLTVVEGAFTSVR